MAAVAASSSSGTERDSGTLNKYWLSTIAYKSKTSLLRFLSNNANCIILLAPVTMAKIPDIEKCLDVVATLQAKRGTGELFVVFHEAVDGPGCGLVALTITFALFIDPIPYNSNDNNNQAFSHCERFLQKTAHFAFGIYLCNWLSWLVFARKNHAQYWFSSNDLKALTADFEVSEEKYSQARIEETDSVCLWLGAIVMLEYSLEEVLPLASCEFTVQATDLLQKNLDNV
ncbi:putative prefoldin subunit 3 [Glycine soja]|uniref:Putative prefoldin subunit 3 n=1 Tax=Glycine soja TaxID=3848 RepID=A0A445K0Z1_GLYSO|nr:putative prefoldin subunit 3 [Glycine soja]